MKKSALSLVLILMTTLVYSQVPQKVNYQAVARDLAGNPLVSTPVNVTFDILQGSSSGVVVYSETHAGITTNAFGLFTAVIGGGTANAPFTTANFASISWSGNLQFLQITVNGDVMPATQLLSVPYALHAGTATSGTPGANGIHCWDLNGNGVGDLGSEDLNSDGSVNVLDCKGDSGIAGVPGTNGLGINWQGSATSNPSTPNANDAYYNSTDGVSYIYNGTTLAWDTIAAGGSGDNDWIVNGANMSSGLLGNVGIGTINPSSKLTTVSADTLIASFIGTNPGGAGIAVVGFSPNTPVGALFVSGLDSGIVLVDPPSNTMFVSNNTIGGNMTISTDSTVAMYGIQIANFASDLIFNKTKFIYNNVDSIINYSNSGSIFNYNNGTFLTDSLYVRGINSNNFNWVLANNGVGKAVWKDPSSLGGSGLWQSSSPNIYFNTGYVGIGLTNPSVELDVAGAILANDVTVQNNFVFQDSGNMGAGYVLMDDGSAVGNAIWQHPDSLGIAGGVWTSNGSETILKSINDNVGIGTATPIELLHLYKGADTPYILVESDGNYDAKLITANGTSSAWAMGINNSINDNFSISYDTDRDPSLSAPHFVIETGGGVGIGVTNPAYKLHVHEPSVAAALISMTNTSTGTFATDGFVIGSGNSGKALLMNREATDMLFYTNNTPYMALDATGNLGVGTLIPAAKLHLNGTLRLGNLGGTAPVVGSVLTSIGTNGDAQWQAPVGGAFTSNGTETVLNTISDNVGIGIANPLSKLHVDNGYIYNNWTNIGGAYANLSILNATGTTPSYNTGTLGIVGVVASPSTENKIAIQGVAGGDAGLKYGITGAATGLGSNYGVSATAYGGSLNNAVHAIATASGSSQAMGIYSTVGGTTSNTTYGIYGQNSSATTGLAYAGYFQNMNGTGSGTYGVRADVNSSNPNRQYGFYAEVTSSGGGLKYGLYSNVAGGTTNWAGYFAAGNVFIADTLVISAGAGVGKVLTSDATGKASWKGGQIAYEAYVSTSQVIVPGAFGSVANLVNFGNEIFDDGLGYDPLAGVSMFTAPVDGVYHIEVGLLVNFGVGGPPSDIVKLGLMKNGLATPIKASTITVAQNSETSMVISATVKLSKNDKLQVEAISQTGVPNIIPSEATWFSGHLVYEY
ncbi:MAG: hypothetical protein COB15_14365 [Flavobacteriales bacterium]|nr:MAG: hypothetical protein COB15_14365 [Flavobacteriales bacterium]